MITPLLQNTNNNTNLNDNNKVDDDEFEAVDENQNKVIKKGQTAEEASMNIVNKLVSTLSYESNFKIQQKNKEREEAENFRKKAQQQYEQKHEIKPTKKLDDLFGLLNDNNSFNLNNDTNDNNKK